MPRDAPIYDSDTNGGLTWTKSKSVASSYSEGESFTLHVHVQGHQKQDGGLTSRDLVDTGERCKEVEEREWEEEK